MKVLVAFTFLISLLSNSLFSQDTVTIYYDYDWKEISNKDGAEFYRKAYFDSSHIWIAKDYFINGQLQMVGSYKSKGSSIKNGHFIYYSENGNRLSEGNYIMDKQQGEWVACYDNGKPQYEGDFINNVPSGNWVDYYESGEKKSSGKFTAGKSTGTWQYWFVTGEKRSEGKYLNNDKEGLWKYWYASGQLKFEENYKNGMILSITGYYENGVINFKGVFENSLNQGVWTYWNPDGRVMLQGKFNKGQKDGEWVRSFDGGSMKLNYSNGLLIGKQIGGIARNNNED